MVTRAGEGLGKFILYVLFIGLSYLALFAGLLGLTVWISGSGLLEKLSITCLSSRSDMSTYVIAAATLEFAALTMLQQHISRQQDRALNFPDICINRCELITSPEAIVTEIVGTDAVNGDCIIKIFFEKTFPVYYRPKIHRAWVGRIIYQVENKYNKMKVYSSSFKSNQGSVTWDIQVDAPEYILEAVRRNQVTAKQSLEIVYDVSWENQLLPCLNSFFSKLYMRVAIRLEDVGVKNQAGCSFKVRGLEITKVPLWGSKK